MFMHASWSHILGNMLFLAVFGKSVEDAFGHARYLLLYVAGGFAAAAAQAAVTLLAGTGADAAVPMLGASGAIAAVLGGYLMILPFARVRTFPLVFLRIPAVFFIGLWFYLQLRAADDSLVHPSSGGGVAFFAHIGGFAFGFATIRFLKVRNPIGRLSRRA
jgi:membrane associated rhomboid family serine protease